MKQSLVVLFLLNDIKIWKPEILACPCLMSLLSVIPLKCKQVEGYN